MNFKTTLYLAVALVILALGYVALRSQPASTEDDGSEGRPPFGSAIAEDLLEEKPGDLVKVVYRRKGAEEWVFEKQPEAEGAGAQKVWRMTAPLEIAVTSYEIDRVGRQLGSLRYEVSYRPGEAGAVTATEAGLDPPEAIVTLTDAGDRTVAVEIGRPASENATYVRLVGEPEIRVGMSSLRSLFKETALDYRDPQLWKFTPEDVTRVEIIDRSDVAQPVSYVLVEEGTRWMMKSPITAKATSKIDDLIRAMSQLRAGDWRDDRPERLAAYGLDPATWTIRATVEEEIPLEPKEEETGEEEGPKPKPEKKVTVHELHLSERSPIGEETKVYMRIGDEPMVATIMKSTADKLKPDISQWREMRVTTANVTAATRIEYVTPDETAALVKTAGRWSFEADESPAEDAAVRQLLEAIKDLTAVAFVDDGPRDPAVLGLDEPQAEIRLTIPGSEEIERITVGGYTDTTAKRLVYVRRNELASIAKVRAPDAASLTQKVRAYRDRTICDVLAQQFERISLTTGGYCTDRSVALTFEPDDDEWKMTAPVAAAVRNDRIRELVDKLGELRAESIVAEAGEASAYGLHQPAATIRATYRSSADTEDEPTLETFELKVAEHDGRCYAQRADRPTVFEIARSLYEQLFQEYRTREVLAFDDPAVRRLSIRKNEETHVFQREDDHWTYQAEPDLPLDPNKVDNLLLQVKDLKTERYVDSTGADLDLAEYGLSAPVHEVAITLEDGTEHTLLVSDKVCERHPGEGFYATVKGRGDVFLLTPDMVRRFSVSLEELEKAP